MESLATQLEDVLKKKKLFITTSQVQIFVTTLKVKNLTEKHHSDIAEYGRAENFLCHLKNFGFVAFFLAKNMNGKHFKDREIPQFFF